MCKELQNFSLICLILLQYVKYYDNIIMPLTVVHTTDLLYIFKPTISVSVAC